MAGKAENGSGIEAIARGTRPSTAKTSRGLPPLHAANPDLFCNGLLDGKVAGLAAAACEHDLVGHRAEQRGDLAASALQCSPLPACSPNGRWTDCQRLRRGRVALPLPPPDRSACWRCGRDRSEPSDQNTSTLSAAMVAAASSFIVLRLASAMTSASVRPRASMQVPHSKICPLPAIIPFSMRSTS